MKSILLSLSLISSFAVLAQHEQCSHKISDLAEMQAFEENLTILPSNVTTDPCQKVRVVVHVIYDSEASVFESDGMITEEQVLSQVRITNQFFRNDSLMYDPENTPLGFELVLAEEDPYGNPTSGILYHDGVELFGPAWHEYGLQNTNEDAISETEVANALAWGEDDTGNRYLNSYVVSKIDGSQGSGTQAFAYFPTSSVVYGNYNLFNAFGSEELEDEYGQSFDLKSYTDLGHTWTHEVLHNFAIFHTFNGNTCQAEVNPVIQGDRVVDTPPQTQGVGCSGSCGFVSNNVMDYLSQSCKTKITPGQVERAHLAIQNSLADYLVCTESTTGPEPCDVNPDFNADGSVNILDVSVFASSFGCGDDQACYNDLHDLNCDGTINIVDVSLLFTEF